MNEIKNVIIEKISNYRNKTGSNNHIFYIYNTSDNTIISTGVIGKNNFTRSGFEETYSPCSLEPITTVKCLLSIIYPNKNISY